MLVILVSTVLCEDSGPYEPKPQTMMLPTRTGGRFDGWRCALSARSHYLFIPLVVSTYENSLPAPGRLELGDSFRLTKFPAVLQALIKRLKRLPKPVCSFI